MDGIHDLGGKEGYGAIEIDDKGDPFHAEWEGREWGMAQCGRAPGITLDWWRHCRELINPADYLSRPYFDSWAQTDFSTYIEAGWITLEEIAAGRSLVHNVGRNRSLTAVTVKQVLQEERTHASRFDASIASDPSFSIGQLVVTNKHGNRGHTRLPQYARGSQGVVYAYHGAHVFPDLSAQGEKVHQHLYSVAFASSELWPEARFHKDKVFLDLWESYLDGI